MITLNGAKITPTIFNDKTSQVWNVQGISPIQNHVVWEFENEAEFMHVAQLVALLNKEASESTVLEIPFFPYARQDKAVGNNETFAGWVFVELLKTLNVRVVTHDIHSRDLLEKSWVNLTPEAHVKKIIEEEYIELVCFPDEGAWRRYGKFVETEPLIAEKTRDPLTGNITTYNIPATRHEVMFKKILIWDDLCDGGATFIMCAKELYKLGALEVQLFTTHGIYSKGVQVLKDAGIVKIFNRKGEVK